jgi:Fur family ferric uptake transcriptional regulator
MNALTRDARYTALLHEAGLRSTVPRVRVLKLFSASKKPLRIKDILRKLKTKDTDIDMVTIYRVIKMLCKSGIVHRVDFCEDSAYYEFADGKHNRHHMTCTDCRTRVGVDLCPFPDYEERLLKQSPLFSTITRHSMEYFGLCKKCFARDQN